MAGKEKTWRERQKVEKSEVIVLAEKAGNLKAE